MEKLEYLEIMTNGLPKVKDLPKHIVIVGGRDCWLDGRLSAQKSGSHRHHPRSTKSLGWAHPHL
jgi:hypothetical protein